MGQNNSSLFLKEVFFSSRQFCASQISNFCKHFTVPQLFFLHWKSSRRVKYFQMGSKTSPAKKLSLKRVKVSECEFNCIVEKFGIRGISNQSSFVKELSKTPTFNQKKIHQNLMGSQSNMENILVSCSVYTYRISANSFRP